MLVLPSALAQGRPAERDPVCAKLGPERARLRRLALALGEVLTPLVASPQGLAGAYRDATAPAPMLALLDYVAELQQQLAEARGTPFAG